LAMSAATDKKRKLSSIKLPSTRRKKKGRNHPDEESAKKRLKGKAVEERRKGGKTTQLGPKLHVGKRGELTYLPRSCEGKAAVQKERRTRN